MILKKRITGFIYSQLAAGVVLSLAHVTNVSADNAVIVGGGYDLRGSQAQIELNVKWVQQVLKRAGLSVHTFYTDGVDEEVDVYSVGGSDVEQSVPYEALARVFRNLEEANTRYYSNTVPDNSGTTRADELLPELSERLSSAENGDSSPLLVYNGHGGPSSNKPDEVTLKLWDNTSVTAREFHALLEKDSSDLRFVFTQCYSGGFHRLAYKNSSSGLELSDSTRCGFTAESAWRVAEGCSASVETSDYRDYTTYFFASLDGETRDGDSLPISAAEIASIDGNDEIGLRDAHLYTLQNAHSTDLSRSTSEDFLATWQPWLDRWLPAPASLPDNEYKAVAESLASRLGLEADQASGRNIRKQLAAARKNLSAIETELAELSHKEYNTARQLQRLAIDKWPVLAAPYTDGYARLISSGQLQEVSDWLSSQSQYQSLLQNQIQLQKLSGQQLAAEREMTQWYKLLHLRKLSRLKADLYDKGSAKDIESYERLVACESMPLNSSQPQNNISPTPLQASQEQE